MTSPPHPEPSGHDRDPGPDGSEPLDPDQEAVRGLLAEAGGRPETLPPDVATRLDDVLAGLVAERPAAASAVPTSPDADHAADTGLAAAAVGTPGDELAARRHRRWPKLLVAAATVGVLGVGLGEVVGGGTASMDAGGSSGEEAAVRAPSATTDRDGGAGQGDQRGQDSVGPNFLNDEDASGGSTGEPEREVAPGTVDVVRLRTESLRTGVERALTFFRVPTTANRANPDCSPRDLTPGDEALAVRLDGRRAVLVLRAPVDGRRAAEVFTCEDRDTPEAATTVEAR